MTPLLDQKIEGPARLSVKDQLRGLFISETEFVKWYTTANQAFGGATPEQLVRRGDDAPLKEMIAMLQHASQL